MYILLRRYTEAFVRFVVVVLVFFEELEEPVFVGSTQRLKELEFKKVQALLLSQNKNQRHEAPPG